MIHIKKDLWLSTRGVWDFVLVKVLNSSDAVDFNGLGRLNPAILMLRGCSSAG